MLGEGIFVTQLSKKAKDKYLEFVGLGLLERKWLSCG